MTAAAPQFAIAARLAALPFRLRAIAAFASGAIMVPAMPPYGWWPLMLAGFSALYVLLLAEQKSKAAFAFGWLFGFGYFGFGLAWIANALLVDGNDFAWVWPLAIAGLPALLALFTAAACALAVTAHCRTGMAPVAFWLELCGLLMLAEWLRGHAFTGFPWNLYGYAWAKTLPLAQLAALGNMYWLSLLTALAAALPGLCAALWPDRKKTAAALAAGAALCALTAFIWGSTRLQDHPAEQHTNIAIRLVQPNIPQADKWDPEKTAANLQKLLAQSEARRVNDLAATVIVWPETAISDFTLQSPAARNAIKAVLAGYNSPVYLLSGVTRVENIRDGESARRYYNSLVLYDRTLQTLEAYDKAHLVPFGEYIPFQDYLPLQPFVQYAGFEAGSGLRTVSLPAPAGAALPTFSPLVCYEIIFPGAVSDPSSRPDFMVNVTNDSWYGDSAGPHQHFAKAQFRAIEEGIPVVRSANTGISGIIDPLGRVTHADPLFTAAGHNLPLPKALTHPPPASTRKDSLFFISLALIFVLSGLTRLRGF